MRFLALALVALASCEVSWPSARAPRSHVAVAEAPMLRVERGDAAPSIELGPRRIDLVASTRAPQSAVVDEFMLEIAIARGCFALSAPRAFRFTIDERGHARDVTDAEGAPLPEPLGGCVEHALRYASSPKPNGGPVDVIVPAAPVQTGGLNDDLVPLE